MIRFPDSEWAQREDAALRHRIPAGVIVRSGALGAAGERLAAPPPATVSPGYLALIKATFCTVHVLATLRREELLDSRGEDELDEAAPGVTAETMNDGPA